MDRHSQYSKGTARGLRRLIMLFLSGWIAGGAAVFAVSADADLASLELRRGALSIGPLSPEFSSSGTSYAVSVPRVVTRIALLPQPSDAGAKVEALIHSGTNIGAYFPVQPNIPVAVGLAHRLALKPDGKVVAWGDNSYLQTDIPEGLTTVVALAAGGAHSLALKADGKVVAWGNNSSGQTDVPAELSGVTAIAAGAARSIALTNAGTVTAWGDVSGEEVDYLAGLTGVTAIAAGEVHTLALAGGEVFASGDNSSGQTDVPVGLTGVTAIAAGGYHSLALKADGTVAAWGNNDAQQTAIPEGLTGVVALAAGAKHSLALNQDGTVVAWGDNSSGQASVPVGLTNVVAIAAGGDYSLALKGDGSLVTWGATSPEEIDFVTRRDVALSKAICFNLNLGVNTVVVKVTAADQVTVKYYSVAVTRTPSSDADLTALKLRAGLLTPVFSGSTTHYALSVGVSASETRVMTTLSDYAAKVETQMTGGGYTLNRFIVPITSGSGFGMVIKPDGNVAICSENPDPVPSGSSVAVAAGTNFGLILRADGTLYAGGGNTFGQTDVPAGLNNVVAIAAGGEHALALKGNGTVAAWGSNSSNESTVPAWLGSIRGIAAGISHSLALKSDGTVIAWGNNESGQCSIPEGLSGVVAIAAGGAHNLALKNDGTVEAWGENASGQTDVPAELSNVVAIAASGSRSMALKADGRVVVWGAGFNNEAALLGTLHHVVAIAAGEDRSMVLKADGSVVMWADQALAIPEGVSGLLPGVQYPLAMGSNELDVQVTAQDGTVKYYSVTITRAASSNKAVTSLLLSNGVMTQIFSGSGTDFSMGGTVRTYDGMILPVAVDSAAKVETRMVNASGTGAYSAVARMVPIAAASDFSLAILADGKVEGGGSNSMDERSAIPADLTDVTAVAVGAAHGLALTGSGTVVAWGNNESNQTAVPANLSGVVAIAAGDDHSLALRGDGTLAAWGANAEGQSAVPGWLSDVMAIAAGGSHSLALRADGTVVGWGNNGDGQTTIPDNLTSVVAIAAGGAHSLALTGSGTVVAWGNNESGQTGIPASLNEVAVVAIAAGGNRSMALDANGTVTIWGDVAEPEAVAFAGLKNVVAIAAASKHSLALKADGTLVSWTDGQADVLPTGLAGLVPGARYALTPGENRIEVKVTAADGTSKVYSVTLNRAESSDATLHSLMVSAGPLTSAFSASGTSYEVSGVVGATALTLLPVGSDYAARVETSINGGAYSPVSRVSSIAAGNGFNLAISHSDGRVVAWGDNSAQQTEVPGDLTGVTAVAAGTAHAVALTGSGTVVAWGNNESGQCTVPAGLRDVVAIAAGGSHSLALKYGGSVVAWGQNASGESTVPDGVKAGVVAIAAGGSHSLALTGSGTVVTWGNNDYQQSTAPESLNGVPVLAIAAGAAHSLALTGSGTVVAWGNNDSQQCEVPTGLTGVVAIAAGGDRSLALKADGTIVAWGAVSGSEAGVLSRLENVVAIAAGEDHSIALKADGRVIVRGDVGTEQSEVPGGLSVLTPGVHYDLVVGENTVLVRVTAEDGTVRIYRITLTRVVNANADLASLLLNAGTLTPAFNTSGTSYQMSVGASATATRIVPMAVDRGAKVETGTNGVYSVLQPLVPLAVGGDFGLVIKPDGNVAICADNPEALPPGSSMAVAAGTNFGLILRADGTVYAGGENTSGQTDVPAGLSNVVAIAAGGEHALALKSDGTVEAWGNNDAYQSMVPVGLTNVAAIAAGSEHSLALKSDGTVIAWGNNESGQCAIPEGLTGVVAIAAGGAHNLVLKNDGSVVAWGENGFGQTDVPAELSNVVAIAAAGSRSMVLKGDGSVVVWGSTYSDSESAIVKGLTNIVAIAAGADRSMVLKADGSVVMWADQTLAIPEGVTGLLPGMEYPLAMGNNVVDVKVTAADGTVKTYSVTITRGANTNPNLTSLLLSNGPLMPDFSGSITHYNLSGTVRGSEAVVFPLAVDSAAKVEIRIANVSGTGAYSTLPRIVPVAANSDFGLVIQPDGTVAALGDGGDERAAIPSDVAGVTAVAVGTAHGVALTGSGTVVAWGNNESSQTAVPANLSGVVGIAAGDNHSLALTGNGGVVAWGANDSAQSAVPGWLSGVMAVAAGGAHSLALKNDGTVVAWGDNSLSQTDVPPGLTGVVAIAAGSAHSLALKSDGTVVAWGDDSSLQIEVPAGLQSVVAIAAGGTRSLALKADGSVVAWGGVSEEEAAAFAGLNHIVAIAAGDGRSLALKADGTLVSWTAGVSDGSVGFAKIPGARYSLDYGTNVIETKVTAADGTSKTYSVTVTRTASSNANLTSSLLSAGPLTSIFNGTEETHYIVSGTVRASGATIVPTTSDYLAKVETSINGGAYSPVRPVKSIAAGDGFSLAIRTDRTVAAWGAMSDENLPEGLVDVVAVAAGDYHGLALTSGSTVVAWGTEETLPVGLTNVVAIAAGGSHSLALKSDGLVAAWGSNDNGESTVPASLDHVVAIAAGAMHSLAIQEDGRVVAWGNNDYGQSTVPDNLNGVVAIAGGLAHSLALTGSGTVVAWGDDSYMQAEVPEGLTGVVAIAAGGNRSMALKADGTVAVWGDVSLDEVEFLAGVDDVVAIAAGASHSLALKADGTVIAWDAYGEQTDVPEDLVALTPGVRYALALGANVIEVRVTAEDGTVKTYSFTVYRAASTNADLASIQLSAGALNPAFSTGGTSYHLSVGINTTETSVLPVALDFAATVETRITSGSNSSVYNQSLRMTPIASGSGYSLIVNADGTVSGLGNDDSSQLSTIPDSMMTFGSVTAVAAGGAHCLALNADGRVLAWGNDDYAQAEVSDDLKRGVVAVAAGGAHSLALKKDGTVVAWGNDENGQSAVPEGLTDVVAIAAGEMHSLALKFDGNVVAWGGNGRGQSTVPADLRKVVAIAAGGSHSLALTGSGTVRAWGSNSFKQTDVPKDLTGVVAIAAGGNHSLALKADGTVVAWGDNSWTQTDVPADLTGVVAIAAGSQHSLAMKWDGTLVGWGDNTYGENDGLDGFAGPLLGTPYALEVGDNRLDVQVTAQDGSIKTYSLTITRVEPAITSDIAVQLKGSSQAVYTAAVNPGGVPFGVWFETGTNAEFTEATSTRVVSIGSGLVSGTVTAIASGLTPGANYFCRVKAIPLDDGENAQWALTGTTYSFKVNGNTTNPPLLSGTATVKVATTFKGGGASLGGFVNPNEKIGVDYYFQYGTNPDSFDAVTLSGSLAKGTRAVAVNGTISEFLFSETYYWRLVASSATGISYGTVFALPRVAVNEVDTATDPTLLILSGGVDPNGVGTTIKGKVTGAAVLWQYGPAKGKYVTSTPIQVIPSDEGEILVSGTLQRAKLKPSIYYYRIVVANDSGVIYGPEQKFTTMPPEFTSAKLENVTVSSALLKGTVNPNGLPMEVSLEYGLTTQYLADPVSFGDIGGGMDPVPVEFELFDLVPNAAYHYRLVATDTLGKRYYGKDQILVTSPRIRTEVVAAVGDSADGFGIAGATFASFGNPAINAKGNVAFLATVGNPSKSLDKTNNAGIWAERTTTWINEAEEEQSVTERFLIAQTGKQAPGTRGTFATLGEPLFNDYDQVAFLGTLNVVKGGPVTAANATGIWATGTSGTLELVARTQDADVQGLTDENGEPVSGAKFASFTKCVLANDGGVIFLANLAVGPGGVTKANDQGVWRRDNEGNWTKMICKGDPITVTVMTKTPDGLMPMDIETTVGAVSVFTAPGKDQIVGGQSRHFTSAGDLICRVTCTDTAKTSCVVTVAADGTLSSVVAVKGGDSYITDSEDGVDALFSAFENPAIGNDGSAAFRAAFAGGGVKSSNNSGIFDGSGSLLLRLGSVDYSPASDADGNPGVFAKLGDPVCNGLGGFACLGTIKVAKGIATAADASVIWTSDGVMVRAMSQAPGCPEGPEGPDDPAGAKFKTFTNLVLPDGGMMFTATLGGGSASGVTKTNDQGLWATDSDGILSLMVRTGDGFVIDEVAKIISSFSIFKAAPEADAQTRSFSTITAQDGVTATCFTYKATFTDGGQAIFRAMAAPPAEEY